MCGSDIIFYLEGVDMIRQNLLCYPICYNLSAVGHGYLLKVLLEELKHETKKD